MNAEERAKKLADEAKGSFDPSELTQTETVSTPVIDWISKDPPEQVHYLLYNDDHGFRIIDPDGTENTPHHESSDPWGDRYLVITNFNIQYVVGRQNRDIFWKFYYDDPTPQSEGEIVSVEAETGLFKSNLWMTTADGTKYKFWDLKNGSNELEEAAKFIDEKLKKPPNLESDSYKSSYEKTADEVYTDEKAVDDDDDNEVYTRDWAKFEDDKSLGLDTSGGRSLDNDSQVNTTSRTQSGNNILSKLGGNSIVAGSAIYRVEMGDFDRGDEVLKIEGDSIVAGSAIYKVEMSDLDRGDEVLKFE